MYQCVKPYQFVKESSKDYLVEKIGKYYVNTIYAGLVEIEKDEFERLKKRGLRVRE